MDTTDLKILLCHLGLGCVIAANVAVWPHVGLATGVALILADAVAINLLFNLMLGSLLEGMSFDGLFDDFL